MKNTHSLFVVLMALCLGLVAVSCLPPEKPQVEQETPDQETPDSYAPENTVINEESADPQDSVAPSEAAPTEENTPDTKEPSEGPPQEEVPPEEETSAVEQVDNNETDVVSTEHSSNVKQTSNTSIIDSNAKDAPNAPTGLKNAIARALTGDWSQWGGNSLRNNTPEAINVPIDWDTGNFDRQTGEWDKASSKNIKWVVPLGSQTYGNAVVADGKVFVGTNNGAGYLKRYPGQGENAVDLGCLICVRESDGKFLWQHSSEKLKTGRVHDWPLQGICCAPLVEGKRLWFVTSRGEVRCLDTEGFHDDENNGPYKDEDNENKDEADVIWVFDMMKELGVSQHNMCSCSVTALGDILFVNTSNGVANDHLILPAPKAPSFFAIDKNTGKVLWTDNSPGSNILHGQWSSPTVGVLGGVPQAIFAGGDGWIYSFKADEGKDGQGELLWKFDANPKESKWILGGRGTRNNIIATPVIHNGLVYAAVGQDPEHGESEGHLWCIDPTKRGDVSPQLAFNVNDRSKPLPQRRIQAVIKEDGEIAVDNPNSAVVWHYDKYDANGDGEFDPYLETMHRSCGTVAIKNNLLYIADFSGIFHCLDATTGELFWSYDMLAAAWGSPLIVDGHVYIGDEDGDVSIFNLTDEAHEPINEINMINSVYSTPIIANGTLYISNRTHLFAIEAEKKE